MRRKAKPILTSAVIAALTVAGVSFATSRDSGGGSSAGTSAAPAPPAVDVNNAGGKRFRERGRRLRGDFADADVRAVLKDIRDAVAKQAPEIAGPVIQKAQDDGKITAAQADKLRQAAQDLADGKKPDIRGLGRDADVREVIHEAFEAAHDKVPAIADPIIDKAESDSKITAAQADRIREMVKRGPPPRGPHGGRGFGPPPGFADKDVRAVLEDIREAVAKEAPAVVNPVIDKAEQDGKITAAQADRLRDTVGRLAGGGPPPGRPPRMLDLRDKDVRAVIHDAFEALAAKTSDIAKPIIDKAVADKKITEAQAEQIRKFQGSFRRGPHIEGPGPRFGHRPPDFDRPAMPAPGPPSSIS
jgi:hypothetical protein